jgi:hypothetical protein
MHPFAEEILETARHAHDPSLEDRARVGAKLAARIAAEAPSGGGGGATAGLAGAAKVGVPLLLVALAIGFVTRGGSSGSHRTAVEGVPAAPVVSAVSAPVEPVVASPPKATPEEPPGAPPSESATQVVPAAPAPARPTRAQPPASTDLAGEMALLASAQAAIQAGDYATALAKLDEHQRSFPAGVLGEERTAARVVALCGAGRQSEARSLATAFLSRHPDSPLAPRVRASCGMQ